MRHSRHETNAPFRQIDQRPAAEADGQQCQQRGGPGEAQSDAQRPAGGRQRRRRAWVELHRQRGHHALRVRRCAVGQRRQRDGRELLRGKQIGDFVAQLFADHRPIQHDPLEHFARFHVGHTDKYQILGLLGRRQPERHHRAELNGLDIRDDSRVAGRLQLHHAILLFPTAGALIGIVAAHLVGVGVAGILFVELLRPGRWIRRITSAWRCILHNQIAHWIAGRRRHAALVHCRQQRRVGIALRHFREQFRALDRDILQAQRGRRPAQRAGEFVRQHLRRTPAVAGIDLKMQTHPFGQVGLQQRRGNQHSARLQRHGAIVQRGNRRVQRAEMGIRPAILARQPGGNVPIEPPERFAQLRGALFEHACFSMLPFDAQSLSGRPAETADD